MRVRKVITLLCLAVSICAAQNADNGAGKNKPNLSGTWVLDKSKSAKLDYDLTLVIVHREPEIKINRMLKAGSEEQVEESLFYTDGRAEWDSRKGYWDNKSITRWSGAKLVRRSSGSNPLSDGRRNAPSIVTTEEWELSKDGKTLTRTVSSSGRVMDAILMSGSQVSSKSKFVFNRSS